ncbi:MAG: heme o synthase [Thermoplasmataceae archaeon]
MTLRDAWKLLKVEITFLVLLVATAGFMSAPGALSHILFFIPLLVSGALASMSAGLFNNLYDRDIDVRMKRTRNRESMISGKTRILTVAGTAMVISAFICSWLIINLLTAIFILSGFLSYLFLYTMFLKRRTSWNIVIGGISGSFPALAGWAAVTNSVSLTSIYIAMLVFIWTPTHFWSLAVGNREDYTEAGVPMLPSIATQHDTAKYLTINSAILIAYTLLPLMLSLLNVGIVISVGPAFYILAVLLDSYLVYLMLMQYRSKFSIETYRKSFHFSNYYLMLLLIGICLVIV